MASIPEIETIDEQSVTIEELPLIIDEEPITIEQELITIAEEPVTTIVQPAKRKPGRPAGSKSKEAGKPRKPREKKVVFEEPVETLCEDLPRAIPGSLPIPTEAYDLRTAKMLRLLQMQTDHRKQQKANVYSSWFR